jgi:TP901 family phage tail tape measure protein
MNAALNNLMFTVSLIDRVSAPMGRVMESIHKASVGFQSGFTKMGIGAAGMVGAAYSVNQLLEPTKEMQRALGEVKSLGVAQDTLDLLRNTALKFSIQYGESAADVVRSSYQIAGAISGLAGPELAAFTQISGLLAKGTKANVSDVTNYVGTMYGIFQKNADAMGKAQWLEQMAAQTAQAVNIFKTDGKGMADAFTAIGANATQAGIALSEQFSVLGRLQASMSGSMAGTKYRAFLDNVGKAQQVLGLSFVDAQDHMLPITEILDRINGKFGDLGKVATAGLLKKAFGSDEAVALVQMLSLDVAGLRNNIADIGNQNGLQSLSKMADAMTDPWGRMRAGIDAISIGIGTELLPVLLPAIESINKLFNDSLKWIHANKDMAKMIGLGTLSIFGSIGAVALFGVAAGWAEVMTTGWGVAMKLIFNPITNLAKAIWGALPSIWSFTAALFANPITWWIVGITALVALVAGAVIYWDQWTAVVANFGGRFMKILSSVWETMKGWWNNFKSFIAGIDPFYALGLGIGMLIAGFEAIPQWWEIFTVWFGSLDLWGVFLSGIDWLVAKFDTIKNWWTIFKDWFNALSPMDVVTFGVGIILASFDNIKTWWTEFKAWLAALNPLSFLQNSLASFMSGINKGLSFANKLPGMNIAQSQSVTAPPLSTSPRIPIKSGGISKQISTMMNNNNSKNNTIGTVNIYPSGAIPNGAKLIDEMKFALGG